MATATQTYTVIPAADRTGTSFASSRTVLRRGFFVVNSDGRAVRAFAQGTAQKWTPSLEDKLRNEAEAWAAILTKRSEA